MDITQLNAIAHEIKAAAIEVRRHLCPGYLEIIYKKALYHELITRGIPAVMEKEIAVTYKGMILGYYRADIVVADQIILEIKAVSDLTPNHSLQLLNYLTATKIDHGILINYGENYRFRYKTRLYDTNTPMLDLPHTLKP